ncbi:uncharacterized protein N0V89_000379 [Didymosphaeria variabile]|uniref:Uncharacterized protein n=1 Tax=Didymosphaeria variabile TaxID=1932322 RepID=A0A9W9CEW0_9PLEO|nr:uncharacterized protein N0V89_000379 [Didymosphaeria variabile]KAJ4359823.1 hypothetical protein N0V89_000379 [Didymosphaeria variabile]
MSSSQLDAVVDAIPLDTFSRFIGLFDHVKSLIGLHGEYTTLRDPIIFARAQRAPPTRGPPMEEEVAHSLSAAQDAINTTQPVGPAQEDLQLFKLLWDAAIDAMEKALDDGHLHLEVRAWGIIGLAAGYMDPQTTSVADKEDFAAYRDRLRAALVSLPSLTSPHNAQASGVSPDQRVYLLTKAKREVHTCSNLLLQQFRKDKWTSVRWYHGLAVAKRWVGNLASEQTVAADEDVQEVLEGIA